jgi:hypothetical protein
MVLHLNPETEKRIKELVASGRYPRPEAVVQAALNAWLEGLLDSGPVAGEKTGYGCMEGTITICGDIMEPLDVKWEANE